MKIKKIFCILALTIMLTGCTTDYNIAINDGVIEENINIYVNKNDSTEIDTFNYYTENDVISFTDTGNIYVYKKSLFENQSGVNLKFKYRNLNAYALSSFFNDCFSKSSISSDNDYIYIKASGFTCYSYNYMIVDNANVYLSTNHEVVEHNASEVIDGIYKWYPLEGEDINLILKQNKQITQENSNEEINRDDNQNTNNKNSTNWILVSLVLIAFISIIFLLAIYKIKRGQRG